MQCLKCFKGYLRQFRPKPFKNKDKLDKRCDNFSLVWVLIDAFLLPDLLAKDKEARKVQSHLEGLLDKDHKAHKYVLVGDEKSTNDVKTAIKYVLKGPIWSNWFNKFNKSEAESLDMQIVHDDKKIDEIMKTDECVHFMICTSVATHHCREIFCLPTNISNLDRNVKARIILVKRNDTTDEELMASLENLQQNPQLQSCVNNITKITFPDDIGNFTSTITTMFIATLLLFNNLRK